MSSIDSASSPAVSLDSLLKHLADLAPRIVGNPATIVSSISEDSRCVVPQTLFVARRGLRSHGAEFVDAAIRAGATAILCAPGSQADFEPRLEVDDVAEAWGRCAQQIHGFPARDLTCIGITGTNGKTTVACLVEQALRGLGQVVGRVGTLGFFVNDEKINDSLTTPQADVLARSMAEARARGAKSMVLEVSSHALSQKRVAGVDFAVVAFTNLSQDHLDYHATMEAYGNEKAKLFRTGHPGARVLNLDDEWGRKLAQEFPDAVTVSASDRAAVLTARDPSFDRTGLSAVVHVEGQGFQLESPLLGRHNLENLLVAWGILHACGVPPHPAARALGQARGVPGRLERCDQDSDDIIVVVDYAHTPDALARALSTLRQLSFSEVVCVFGCGGDRDRKKRPLMGAEASRGADRVYLTSDNPRTEDPLAIIADVRPGLTGHVPVVEEVDRRRAVTRAIREAHPGAVVLVAGKGHEDYQLMGDQVIHFDDREEARHALELRRAAGRDAS